jgi:hypothetical protein
VQDVDNTLTPTVLSNQQEAQWISLSDLMTGLMMLFMLIAVAFMLKVQADAAKRLTENELSDFRRLWHDGCGETIIEAQDVDRNHSPEV